jgi:hypothetical protein
MELNYTKILQNALEGIKQYSVEEVKEALIGKARQYVADALFSSLQTFLPFDVHISDSFGTVKTALNYKTTLGEDVFEIILKHTFCNLLPEPLQKFIFFEPEIYTGSFNAKNHGYQCPQIVFTNKASSRTSRPDFIATSGHPRTSNTDGERSLLVGDIKLSIKTVVEQYFGWQGKGPRNVNQWNTMTGYAKKHGAYAVGFISLYNGGPNADALRQQLIKEAAQKQVIVFFASAQ